MIQSNKTKHDAKMLELKSRFEGEGYEVLVEPHGQSLPFDLGNYVPDLIAKKGDGGLIVEVKTTAVKKSVEKYQEIAQTVQRFPSWRFLLVTVDDLNIDTHAIETSHWEALEEKLGLVNTLILNGSIEPAVLYLWSIFEAAMRKLAIDVAMPIERLPAIKVMNQLYTAGYIAVDDFAAAKNFLQIRNTIAHGLTAQPEPLVLHIFIEIVSSLMQEWRSERGEHYESDESI